MSWVIVAGLVWILLFGFVVAFGAPYLPTLRASTNDALDLLNLKPGQILVELGSGDGRVLRAAAQRGIRGVGYELNPLLVFYARLRHYRYRHLISFKCRDYWRTKLPDCDGIYVFLLQKYMPKLDKKITQEIHSSVKLVSYAFTIPGKSPKTEVNGLFLYEYQPKK